MSISKRKLKSGKTVYDVTTYAKVDGRWTRRKVTCKTKHEAEYVQARDKATRSALKSRSGRVKLSDYIERVYWPNASKRLAATSKDTYKREIDKRIIPALGRYLLEDIDRQAIQEMVDRCATEAVARKAVSTLKTILNEAKADGLVIANAAQAKFTMPDKGRKRDNGLVLDTFEQIGVVVDIVASRASECVQRLAMTGLLLGLRPEERYALDWDDFDLEERTVTISAAFVVASKQHGGNQLKGTKTELSTRVLPLSSDFAAWLETQARTDGAFIKGFDGKRISPSTARHRWDKFLRDNPDCPQVTLENMRHSFATSYLAAGGRVETLSRILGHSNIDTTLRRYVRPGIESLRADVDATVHIP